MIRFLALLAAAINPMDTGSISSNGASYDGSMLVLDGDVSLEHGFGTMKADKAVLTRQLQQEQTEFPFTYIELARAVHLSLTTEAQVDCERASLDFSSLKGVLTSPKNVHYVDQDQLNTVLSFSAHILISK
jgi:lipopolysaccharide export system protein LptA